jgi:hypothetical protein
MEFKIGDTIRITEKQVNDINETFINTNVDKFINKGFVIASRTIGMTKYYTIKLCNSERYFPITISETEIFVKKVILTERKIFGNGI